MVISHNIIAIDTYKSLKKNEKVKDGAISKIASGLNVQSAADDAAGLSISEKMKTQIRGLNKASVNTENAISMLQIAEAALKETHSALGRMRELAIQSANGTNGDMDRNTLQEELEQLTAEINRIGDTTEFNGVSILNGTRTDSRKFDEATGILVSGTDNSVYFQVGANANETINVSFEDMTAVAIGVATINITDEQTGQGTVTIDGHTYSAIFSKDKNVLDTISNTLAAHSLDIRTREGANSSIDIIDNAIGIVSKERSKYGTIANRLEHTANSLDVIYENMVASESRIVDSDIAKQMVNLTKSDILVRSAQSLLSQAMLSPKSALGLLNDAGSKQSAKISQFTASRQTESKTSVASNTKSDDK